ncbi:MAG TPA: metallophosphoesterase [Thermodesulfovibrionales bacterium]|nr:metallophosphoesterase [Thermodesulfovibrionales bacterium]
MKRPLLLLMCAILLLLWGCSSSSDLLPFTVKASIQTSASAENPPVVDPASVITLEFSEPLDLMTVEGRISLYTVKAGDALLSPRHRVEIVPETEETNRLIIKTKSGALLPSGELYRLVVSKAIKSSNGNTLAEDFVGYFATDYSLSYGPFNIPELGNDRTMIVVISDIHMGDLRSMNGGYGWFKKNSGKLVSFLNLLGQMPNVRELVIAGDMFDEWVAPMDADTFNRVSQSGFVDMIAAANQPVVDAMNRIIRGGDIKVTYVPGNHDMLVESADIQRIFPGISEARDNAKGMGAYTPQDRPEIVIEHGHRYDFFNAPDPISNRSITKTDSITPPGFFVSKIATTSDLERGQSIFYRDQLTGAVGVQYYLSYWAAWQLIMSQKPVKESWTNKIIKTGMDGYAGSYAIDDLIPAYSSSNGPLDVSLYKGIADTWYDRQAANNVLVPILPEVAIAAGALTPVMDAQSTVQYFLNTSSNKRIVVFGHTHHADLLSSLNHKLQGAIYANTGTWIDNGNPSCTFVTIIPGTVNSAVTGTVTVYQYMDDNTINKIRSAVITN